MSQISPLHIITFHLRQILKYFFLSKVYGQIELPFFSLSTWKSCTKEVPPLDPGTTDHVTKETVQFGAEILSAHFNTYNTFYFAN
jgi:hypothetical protein